MAIGGIADYRFVSTLGPANYGTYFLAERPSRLPIDAPQVVVKVMAKPSGDDGFRHAVRELEAFAATQSPYLVSLYDAGQDQGSFYYAMEYLPGGSLATSVHDISRTHAIVAVEHAARAAHALHESGLVHRDIRPANVWLTDDGGKLSDLGLTQALAPELTMTGMGALASVEFVDPAIFRGARASRATDIWALGATLHWAIAGSGLYGEMPNSDSLLAMRRVMSSAPAVSAQVSGPLGDLVRACLAEDVSIRPRTALDVAELIAMHAD